MTLERGSVPAVVLVAVATLLEEVLGPRFAGG